MCHVSKSVTLSTPVAVEATPVIGPIRGSKSTATRISPFRKIAKTAKVNLNKYWAILSHRQPKPANTTTVSTDSSLEFDFSSELEENYMNEMMERLANAEEQKSIYTEIDYDSSPEPPRRALCRQRALLTSSNESISFCLIR